jgi:hypothetical protein
MLKIKGFTVQNAFDRLREKYGSDGIALILARMDDASRAMYEGSMRKDSWVSIEVYTALLHAVVDEYYDGDIHGAGDVGYVEMESAFAGVYRFFVRVGPHLMARVAPLYWKQVYQGGRLELFRNDKKVVIFRLHLSDAPDPIMCWEILGSLRAGVIVSGGKLASAEHTVCAAEGNPYCEFKLTLKD